MKAVLIGSARDIAAVYPPQIVTQLAGLVELYEPPIEKKDLDACRDALSQAEAAFSTWGMLPLSEAEIAQYLPQAPASILCCRVGAVLSPAPFCAAHAVCPPPGPPTLFP